MMINICAFYNILFSVTLAIDTVSLAVRFLTIDKLELLLDQT